MDFEILPDGYDRETKKYIICIDLRDDDFLNIELSKGLLSLDVTEYTLKEFYKHLKDTMNKNDLL